MNVFCLLMSILLASLGSQLVFSAPDSKSLTLITHAKMTSFSRFALINMKLETIKMDYSRAYPKRLMNYKGIRLCNLLKDYSIKPNSILEFIAEDNFSVLIPAHYVLNCNENASIAYLVIEPKNKWPILDNYTNTTAGPYALIWTNPERSYISDEYWAWSVTQIIEHTSMTGVILAPKNLPLSRKKQILNGYKVYVSHCSSCHTINYQGKASIGPDLMWPKNPFDYYPDIKQFKQFVRDPQSVRKIPNGRMSGSSYIGLHDKDLDDLICYLKFINKVHK
ncbi:hypothetical protein Lgra_3141 [Legionella gratiana]|uniref:Cytochrome c, mono- and diheme variants n=1 Tax=Legionella gratiana TaxID=45066 RepID=A0A378JBJ8_9GAMM|nr:cytochrome c [Legionella gratiana]KTD06364.1 hypothetical protein Lgra_3141 [Legionella gratiana]STX45182.1 Cytochrome c, mono- and diheme variants [Legionella gratiana]